MLSEEKLKEMIQAEAEDGRITCAQLWKIAGEHEVALEKLGRIADELKIKITRCQLGCF